MTVCQQSRAAAALSGNGRRSLQQALPLSENEKQSSSSRPSRRPPPPPPPAESSSSSSRRLPMASSRPLATTYWVHSDSFGILSGSIW